MSSQKPKITLIDGYGFVFRAFHSLPPLTRADGTPVGAVYGFTNMITPTSGVLMGVLGVAKIPYDKWVKWITPLMIILLLLGFLLLIPTVTMDLPGFELDLHLR